MQRLHLFDNFISFNSLFLVNLVLVVLNIIIQNPFPATLQVPKHRFVATPVEPDEPEQPKEEVEEQKPRPPPQPEKLPPELEQLVDMGIDLDTARAALLATDNNVEAAIAQIFG